MRSGGETRNAAGRGGGSARRGSAPDLGAQAAALRKRLELATGRLPSEREIPGLYRQVSDLALQAGLAVALFAPKPAEDKDTVSEIPITVSAEGAYHQLGTFFSRIGRIPRIVNLGDFRLAARRASDRELAGGPDAGHLSGPARGLATGRRHSRPPGAGVFLPPSAGPPEARDDRRARGPNGPDSKVPRGRLARPRALGGRVRRRDAAESAAGRRRLQRRAAATTATAAVKPGRGTAQGTRAGTALAPASSDAEGQRGLSFVHRFHKASRGCLRLLDVQAKQE